MKALINIRCNNDADMQTLYSSCKECIEALGLNATYYGREAGGKTLALYHTDPRRRLVDDQYQVGYPTIWLDDWYIYGSEADGRIATVDPKEEFASNGDRTTGSEFPKALNNIDNSSDSTQLPSAMWKTNIPYIDATFQTQQRVPDFRRYEIKDHLGNVRTVISDVKNPYVKSGSVGNWTYLADVKNISNMYPYGKSYGANATYDKTDDYRYGFNGMEKERNFSETGDITDFGARVLDDGRFLSRDPLQKNYPNLSPYVFGANNPIAAIDPDGRVVVFINGLHGGNWGDSYWGNFDAEIMNFWKDENVEYYDGSVGGKSALIPSVRVSYDFSILDNWKNWVFGNNSNQNEFTSNNFSVEIGSSSLSPSYRYNQGYAQARADAGRIFDNLGENETIKIVTHSMGYAWGSGYQQGLIDYAVIERKNPQLVNKISIVLNFAPFQSKSYGTNKLLTKKTHHKISFSDPLMYPSWSPENSNDITSFIERLFSSHPISRYTLKDVPLINDNKSDKGTQPSSNSSEGQQKNIKSTGINK